MIKKFEGFSEDQRFQHYLTIRKKLGEYLETLQGIWEDLDMYLDIDISYLSLINGRFRHLTEIVSGKDMYGYKLDIKRMGDFNLEDIPLIIKINFNEFTTGEFLDRLVYLNNLSRNVGIELISWEIWSKKYTRINSGTNLQTMTDTWIQLDNQRVISDHGVYYPFHNFLGIKLSYRTPR